MGPKDQYRMFVQAKRGKTLPPFLLNPGETSREQEGDVPHCLDQRNTNASKDEKERDLEKMEEVLNHLPLSSEPASLC
jgi:hypothetical protein